MKRLFTVVIALAMAAIVTQRAAADVKVGDRPNRGDQKKKILEKFDTDGDGKLNEEERAKAKAAIAKHRAVGVVKAKPRPNREAIVKKFDKDGDGKLNAEEGAAAKAAMGSSPRFHSRSSDSFRSSSGIDVYRWSSSELTMAMSKPACTQW